VPTTPVTENSWIPPLKVQIPCWQQAMLPRESGVLLSACFQNRLSLLQAPAGYGKTTLLAQWSQAHAQQVAWLSLSESDNLPHTFLRCVMRALQEAGLSQSLPQAHISGLEPYALQQILLEQWSQQAGDSLLIFDDYHLIQNPLIHEFMSHWLLYLPTGMHFVIASRSQPEALPLMQLRAKQQLFELPAQALRLQPTEIQAFFALRGQSLEWEQAKAIYQQSQGWILSLHLLSLSWQTHQSLDLQRFSGTQSTISEFLLAEIYQELLPTEQDFVLATSLLETLSPPLCEALSGQTQTGSFLQALARKGLPFASYDPDAEHYAYHPLLRDWLQNRLRSEQPARWQALQAQAAETYARQQNLEQALFHGIQGQAWQAVSQILQAETPRLLAQGYLSLLISWFEQIPAAVTAEQPHLLTDKAKLYLLVNRVTEAWVLLDQLQAHPATQSDEALQLQVAALTASWACRHQEMELCQSEAQRVLTHPAAEPEQQVIACLALAYSYTRQQRFHDTLACYEKVEALSLQAAHWFYYLRAVAVVACFRINKGDLFGAERSLQQCHQLHAQARYAYQASVGLIYIELARLHFLWHDLENMKQFIHKCLKQASYMHPGDVMTLHMYRTALILFLEAGQISQAQEVYTQMLQALQAEIPKALVQDLQELEGIYTAYLELFASASGAGLSVSRAFKRLEYQWLAKEPNSKLRMASLFLLLKYHLFRQEPQAAHALLEQASAELPLFASGLSLKAWQQATPHPNWYLKYAKTQIFRALIDYHVGQPARAVAQLAEVLGALAAQQVLGLLVLPAALSFLQLKTLLKQAVQDPGQTLPTDYLQALALAYGEPSDFFSSAQPLSQREEEILSLMTQGLSNAQISRQLFISGNTLKTHIRHIFRKLEVPNRQAAVQRAAQLKHN